mmetsp:Transcript_25004/g.71858  ORF Transcript_25004/g.71858 Transcript_25004/m.71858 type:complete len:416 (+) Transcript_25004:162-1409(+)
MGPEGRHSRRRGAGRAPGRGCAGDDGGGGQGGVAGPRCRRCSVVGRFSRGRAGDDGGGGQGGVARAARRALVGPGVDHDERGRGTGVGAARPHRGLRLWRRGSVRHSVARGGGQARLAGQPRRPGMGRGRRRRLGGRLPGECTCCGVGGGGEAGLARPPRRTDLGQGRRLPDRRRGGLAGEAVGGRGQAGLASAARCADLGHRRRRGDAGCGRGGAPRRPRTGLQHRRRRRVRRAGARRRGQAGVARKARRASLGRGGQGGDGGGGAGSAGRRARRAGMDAAGDRRRDLRAGDGEQAGDAGPHLGRPPGLLISGDLGPISGRSRAISGDLDSSRLLSAGSASLGTTAQLAAGPSVCIPAPCPPPCVCAACATVLRSLRTRPCRRGGRRALVSSLAPSLSLPWTANSHLVLIRGIR